ncbi:unnamed protein product [Tilletia caries]|nr:unnamed protein product [Tilletia caries]
MHSRTQLHTRPAPVLHGFYVHDAASAPRPRLRVALRQATQSSRPSGESLQWINAPSSPTDPLPLTFASSVPTSYSKSLLRSPAPSPTSMQRPHQVIIDRKTRIQLHSFSSIIAFTSASADCPPPCSIAISSTARTIVQCTPPRSRPQPRIIVPISQPTKSYSDSALSLSFVDTIPLAASPSHSIFPGLRSSSIGTLTVSSPFPGSASTQSPILSWSPPSHLGVRES